MIGAILADLVLVVALRRKGRPIGLVVAAFILITASLVVFFSFTYPANIATANWTQVPENWTTLRRQWELSHAVNAVIVFASFCCLIWSALVQIEGR